jgi:hypothetical protein
MRTHSANELNYQANILAADGSTVLATGIAAGIEDLTGRRLEQAQLSAPETSHMILFRALDALTLTADGYVSIEGVLYIVDYFIDPRKPRAGTWKEVYCHVERVSS